MSDEDLRRSAVVMLNDVPVSAALARRLARFVEQGGGLFVAAGPRASWPPDVDLLPASIGNPVDRTRGDAARVGALELRPPGVRAVPRAAQRQLLILAGLRLPHVTAAPDAQVLARFDGGAPAVLERRVGTGRVLLWASTLDSVVERPADEAGVPAVHPPVDAPTWPATREPRPWLTVGQVLDATIGGRTQGTDAAARRADARPAGACRLQDEGSDVMELTEQGFYELRGEAQRCGRGRGANVDPAEADLTPMDPKEIVAAAERRVRRRRRRRAGVPLTPEAQEKNQRLWWYLLVAGICCSALDTLLSNRMAKA